MATVKRPSFQFYPFDWLSDINVKMMTYHEKGIYIDLIAICWIEGFIPNDQEELYRLLKLDDGHKEALGRVLKCFQIDSKCSSKCIHGRLQLERAKQDHNREVRTRAGKEGANSRWGKCESDSKPMAKGMAKDSLSSSSSSSISKKNKNTNKRGGLEERGITNEFLKYLKEANPKLLQPRKAVWDNTIRLMIQEDKLFSGEIIKALQWCLNDSFWATVITSPSGLRKNWNQIHSKINGKKLKTKTFAERVEDEREKEEQKWLKK